jgi:dephospho-CoA kinase
MFVLGLTGSVGMGKSTTAALFGESGVPVHDADAVVHALYEGEAVGPIEAAFPGTTHNGKVVRARLAALVLDDPVALRRLEAIVHPMVRLAEEQFLSAAESGGAKVAVLDIPLLFETGGEQRVDAVVVVTADAQIQASRVLARPDMTQAKLDAILARQISDGEKRRRADFIVDSSHGLAQARQQVHMILDRVAKMPRRRQ